MSNSPSEKLTLHFRHGTDSRQIPTSGVSSITIGRSAECTICLDIPKISRVHAEIRIDDSGFRLIDKKSSNGTLLNGDRIETARLREGDRIEIGAAVIEVRNAATKVERPRSGRKKQAVPTSSRGGRSARSSAAASSSTEESEVAAASQQRRSGPTLVNKLADLSLLVLLIVLVGLVAMEYSKGPGKIVREVQPTIGEATSEESSLEIARPMDDGEVSLKLLEQIGRAHV